MTDLAYRMRLHTPGQITWPEPEKKALCISCRHYDPESAKAPEKGRCGLVRKHTKKAGAQFKGGDAIACPQFERPTR